MQSPTWTDHVSDRIDFALHPGATPLTYNLATFVGGGAGPAIDLTSILISGQRDVATNDPAEACPPASVPIDSLSLPLSWAVSGDAVTLTLEVFPTTPFLCGYASFVMTPPEMRLSTRFDGFATGAHV